MTRTAATIIDHGEHRLRPPRRAKAPGAAPDLLADIAAANFGLAFADHGLRARVELERAVPEAGALKPEQGSGRSGDTQGSRGARARIPVHTGIPLRACDGGRGSLPAMIHLEEGS